MSSSSHPNYTDGVPVKIKYKPPPDIHLPTKLVQQLNRTQFPVAFEDYNFDLERKIISKTTEWINYRLKEKNDRQQRIHQRELLRLKRLEEEHKAKLNQVSYPSADELTSDEEDENVYEARHSHTTVTNQQNPSIPSEKLFSENFNSNSILMPTQAMPDIANNSGSSKKSHRRYASNSSNKIDFSFFESDASPFDHLEMKSMNEMEELSKILQSTAIEADDNILERNNSSESEPSESSQKKVNENNNNINTPLSNECNTQQPQQSPYSMQNISQQLYNNYYYGVSSEKNQAYQPTATTTTQNHQNFTPSYILNHQQSHLPNNCYYTQNYAVNHMNYIMGHHHHNNNNTACDEFSDKIDVAKSNSAPDIIKELNDELNNSERRRIRNNSQNSHKNVIDIEEQKGKENEAKLALTIDKDEQFNKLPPKSQTIAKQISQMGFNREMVIRVLNRIGDNDKKIVEHLISLSELLQMGFDESLVLEALIKFDNNKDQALDFLIS
ncbi:hypothetical protein PVAND_002528 [Polypedilum vanderplanki]|uniref:UBA domain-containing protein n=1 Tax=Polypedilum vanderplanki TaxID=319348 RepID=A0A9J6BRZ3_POLVA|nr:hypothetical protein PVAND_002528 [Polypedilum vanderplanki]